jgi:dihydroceramidase
MPKYALPVVAAALLSAITVAVFLSMPPTVWEGWRPATCLTTGCFCEAANPESPIRQLANTISSLGFVFSGALMFLPLSKASRLSFGCSALMGTASIIVGIGSAFYHASLTFSGQFFDVFGMFLLAVFMLTYACERIWTLRLTTSLSLFLTINIFFGWLQFAVPDTRRYVFAIALIVALFLEAYYRRNVKPQITVRWLRLGIGLMAVAYIIWILDNTRIICFEESLLQGHALWHLLGALSVFFLHRYYVSENT